MKPDPMVTVVGNAITGPSDGPGPPTPTLAPPPGSRCAGLSRSWAITVALLLGVLVAVSIAAVPAAQRVIEGHQALIGNASKPRDIALYRGIAEQVSTGGDYYDVAIAAQRTAGYPVLPFFTVRLPTLTWLIVWLSPFGARLLMLLLAATTLVAWAIRLPRLIAATNRRMVGGLLLILLGVFPALFTPAIWFTEMWAGLLIALSLALRGPHRWWPSVAAALAAVLVRELALCYLLAMGLMALVAGQRREALGWGLAGGVFAMAFLAHALAVHALIQPGDPVSAGWSGHGGWALFVASCSLGTMLMMVPPLIAAVLLPFTFFGLAAWRAPVAARTFITLAGYTVVIALSARPDNVYWIWLVGPILGLGWLFAPCALADLISSMVRRPQGGAADERRQ